MNKIGNILTVLILLMSTIFLVIAVIVGASDRNWKEQASKLQQEVKLAKQAVSNIKGTTTKKQKKLELEMASRAQTIANLNSRVLRLQEEVSDLNQQYREVTQTSDSRLNELSEAQSRIATLDKVVASLESEVRERSEKLAKEFETTRTLTSQLNEAKTEIQNKSEIMSNLTSKVALFEKAKIKLGFDETQITDGIPPKIESIVSATHTGGLFEIKLGEDDGIRQGHEMDIYRQNRFIGKGTVVKTNHNNAVLRPIEGLMNGRVMEGDYVSTKL